jgi:glycosyltransferase involved in cell wall biosynthesis
VSAAIVARSAFDAIGGFDERLQAYEDDDLFTRLLQAGYDNVFIDKPLGAWRDEATKKSRSPEAAAGRMAYARKLLDSCDESDGRGIAYGRDLILPRFLHHVAEDLKYALRNRDAQLADACKADLDALEALSHDTDGTGPARGNLLVSVVIPLYNGAAFIAEALRSVLEQTLAPDEIIVVDDGSTDGGPDIVARFAERYPVTILNKPNGGQSSARNLGVKHAHGDLIALLDQDDAWYPSHLAELVRPFRENRSRRLGWTYSNLDEVDRDGELVAQSVLDSTGTAHPKTNVMDCLRQDMFVLPSASVISRKAFLEVGGFDERLSGYEDDDLFIRLLQAGYGNMYIRESLSRWRIYAESTSFSARMARSRMIFARKLVELYPDEKLRNIFYARDLIVPRFLHHVTETMRRALRAGDMPLARNCVEDISVLESMVPATDRPRLFRTNLITSVVVVLHDGAATIAAALNSVLEQTHTPDEIIVVDDGSGDAGLSIVLGLAEKNAITVVSQPGRGTAAARNHGVRLAHGDLIAFLDHDDAWYPTHLATLTEPFRERRGRALGWSYSDIDEIDIRGELVTQSVLAACESVHPKTNVADCLRRDLLIPPSAAILSRHAFDAVGGFDESLTGYEDDDLFTRLLIAGYDSVFFETALTRWRRAQDDRQSRRMAEGRMAYARKLMEAFPDDEEKGRRYTTDLIAPRFAVDMLAEARKALSSKEADPAWIDRCFADLHYLDRFLDAPEGSRFDRRELVISAIIPLYNGAAFIEEALRSVFAQTLLPDEVIVVDDGSTDNGAEIVRRLALTFPIRLLQQKNSGQSAARNSGVDHSHGDLIAFLDQDDIWYPNHLAELVKPFLQEHGAELAWSYSDIDEIDEAGSMVVRGIFAQAKLVHPKRDLITCLSQDMFVLPSATLISRHAFQKAGGFDERLSGYEDDDLFLRLFQAGYNSVFLPEPLSKWRIFQSSSSFSPRMAISRLSYARMLIDRFPDDLTRSLYYTRDLIAPRFFRSIAADLRRSIINKNDTQRLQALSHLAFITGFLRWYLRIPFTFFLLPLLRIPFLAKMLIHYRRPLANVLRRIL